MSRLLRHGRNGGQWKERICPKLVGSAGLELEAPAGVSEGRPQADPQREPAAEILSERSESKDRCKRDILSGTKHL